MAAQRGSDPHPSLIPWLCWSHSAALALWELLLGTAVLGSLSGRQTKAGIVILHGELQRQAQLTWHPEWPFEFSLMNIMHGGV